MEDTNQIVGEHGVCAARVATASGATTLSVEGCGGIFATVDGNFAGSTGVRVDIVGDIIDATIDNEPAVF